MLILAVARVISMVQASAAWSGQTESGEAHERQPVVDRELMRSSDRSFAAWLKRILSIMTGSKGKHPPVAPSK